MEEGVGWGGVTAKNPKSSDGPGEAGENDVSWGRVHWGACRHDLEGDLQRSYGQKPFLKSEGRLVHGGEGAERVPKTSGR